MEVFFEIHWATRNGAMIYIYQGIRCEYDNVGRIYYYGSIFFRKMLIEYDFL